MSPPAVPTMTLSLKTFGDIVIEKFCFASATTLSQSSLPLFASIASRCASIVPIYKVSPRIARPRLTRPQHARASGAGSW